MPHKNKTKMVPHQGKTGIYQNFTRRLGHVIAQTTHDLKRNIQTGIHEKSADLSHTVTAYTNKKPFKSLGLAAFTGFILGIFFKRS